MQNKLSEIGNSIRSASESIDSTSILKKIDTLKAKLNELHGSIRWADEQMELQVEISHLERMLATNGNF